MNHTLEMRNISKSFAEKPIYQNVNFHFDKGCYCIIGPNGVGKTILLEMLAGVIHQDEGVIDITALGSNFSIAYKHKLVYVPGNSIFYPSATGKEFLSFILSAKKYFHKKNNIDFLIEKFNLKKHLNEKFHNMSLGTQKKFFLTTIAIGDNAVIILDEPTNGLDFESNQILHEVLAEYTKKAIVIIATHDSVLLNKLSPTIIELNACPTTIFKIHGV